MARALLALLSLAALATACTAEGDLVVDLRTDLRPGVEVVAAITELDRDSRFMAPAREGEPRALLATEDLLEGIRVAELSELPVGEWYVRVRLLDSAGRDVAERVVAVEVDEARRAVTAVITRDCIDVACPGAGSALAIACLGGECVEPGCSPETPELCPAPECSVDADCPGGPAACAVGVCSDGVCLVRPDDTMCSGAYCNAQRGCEGFHGIAAGSEHTCAIRDGEAWCWGFADGPVVPIPTRVDGLTGEVTALAAGNGQTCAIIDDAAWCWGEGNEGELGDGAARSSDVPVAVSTLPSPVRDISAGLRFSCAVAGTGVYCWGSDSTGRLGNGPGGDSDVPMLVALDPTDAALAEGVAAGGDHGCAFTSDGRGFCWGHNDGPGALGNGDDTIDLSQTPVATLATGLVGVDISGWHACALDDAGALSCWGAGSDGMLGDGAGASSTTPVTPTGLGSGVTAFDTGGGPDERDVTCAVQAGRLLCFGPNQAGRVGDGTENTAVEPVAVQGLPADAREVAVGWTHTCALLVDGSIYCWGAGELGQLGDGAEADSFAPVRILVP